MSSDKVEKLYLALLTKGQTLALAESCTGGMLSSLITEKPGISKVYKGAVVSYAREVKQNILAVPLSILDCHSEVSVPTAIFMARGVRDSLGSSWGLSITGVAGPGGGTEECPLGTVCFGLVGPGFEEASVKKFNHGSRQEIRKLSVSFALDFLLDAV